jgi:hypothetical protein
VGKLLEQLCHLRRQLSRAQEMAEYQYTDYFQTQVLRRRPYLRKHWCIWVIENAAYMEAQEFNRFRFWAPVAALGGRYLRVVTLEDKVTIHNAFPDRGFRP